MSTGKKMQTDWDRSAKAWLTHVGDEGDFSRKNVLDGPMLQRVQNCDGPRVLDIGCGEGRFCRLVSELSLDVTGVDPTEELLVVAREKGGGTYVNARAEELPFWDNEFDLVVFYLSLIDIAGLLQAIREATRVLKPGGHVLVGNLSPWITSSQGADGEDWQRQSDGSVKMRMAHYLDEFAYRANWNDIDIENWHRPLSAYMRVFLSSGLRLINFDEPKAIDDSFKGYDQAPYLYLMEWLKP